MHRLGHTHGPVSLSVEGDKAERRQSAQRPGPSMDARGLGTRSEGQHFNMGMGGLILLTL